MAAFALAFGLGGRQPAERLLSDLIDKAKKEADLPNPLAHSETSSRGQNTGLTPSAPIQEQMDATTISEEYSKADVPPNQIDIDPNNQALNNPFGSTGEPELNVDLKPKDDPK